MTTRGWALLAGANLLYLILGGVITNQLTARYGEGAIPPGILLPIQLLGFVALAGFIVSVPPLMLKVFVAGQLKIGNGNHPMVEFVTRHERGITRAVWLLWAVGVAVALPFALKDLRTPRP